MRAGGSGSRTAAALAVLVLAAGGASAEEARGRTELTAFFGVSLLDIERTMGASGPWFPAFDSRETLSGSPIVGVRLGRRLGERASLDLEVGVAPSLKIERSGFGCGWEFPCILPAYRSSSSASSAFPVPTRVTGAVLPLIYPPPVFTDRDQRAAYQYSLGFSYELTGGAARPYLNASLGGATYDGVHGSATDFRLGVGAGVALGTGALRGRIEVVDFITPNHFLTGGTEHDLQVRAGLSVRVP